MKAELETYIQLRYGEPQATEEWLVSIPTTVLLEIVVGYANLPLSYQEATPEYCSKLAQIICRRVGRGQDNIARLEVFRRYAKIALANYELERENIGT